MKEDFDFNRIGKRLPYTTPDSFLDDIETVSYTHLTLPTILLV